MSVSALNREYQHSIDNAPQGLLESDEDQAISGIAEGIDLRDIQSVLFFGTQLQEQLTTLSDRMLGELRNNETEKAADAVSALLCCVDSTVAGKTSSDGKSFLTNRKFDSTRSDAVRGLTESGKLRDQFKLASQALGQHRTNLIIDQESLDRLHAAGTDCLTEMKNHIAAGEQRLQQLEQTELPRLENRVRADYNMLASQQLRDAQTARDQLAIRVNDLKRSYQVLEQNLPAIRLIQQTERALAGKLQTILLDSIPLWRQELAQASQRLTEALNESLEIAKSCKEARAQATQKLHALENQLRNSVRAASRNTYLLAGRIHPSQVDVQYPW